MTIRESDSPEHRISGLTCTIDNDVICLRWQWPEDVQHVCVYKTTADQLQPLAELSPGQLKHYTREEYKANNGYRDLIKSIDRFAYTVYGCLYEDGGLVLIDQMNSDNQILVSTGKTKIYYSITQKPRLFNKFKTVQIHIRTELPLKKEVLCYVKKTGGYPQHKEDGIIYPFVQDFPPGKTVLPAIEIGKTDHIRLFFTDGKKYGQIHELIPE